MQSFGRPHKPPFHLRVLLIHLKSMRPFHLVGLTRRWGVSAQTSCVLVLLWHVWLMRRLVFVCAMNESVYQLIPPQIPTKITGPMYRSTHVNLAPSCSTFALHGTSKVLGNVAGNADEIPVVHPAVKPVGSFGKSVSHTVDPHHYLKKGGSLKNGGASQTFTRSAHEVKPPVPPRTDRPVMGLTSDKNFVVSNAVESVLSPPKRAGTTGGGRSERAVDRKSFGRVPGYLLRVKGELDNTRKMVEDARKAEEERNALEILSEDDVQELRSALKARHDALSKQFQTLSFTLETETQKKRKESLEREMAEIEGYLKKISKPRIVILND